MLDIFYKNFFKWNIYSKGLGTKACIKKKFHAEMICTCWAMNT